MGLEKPLNCLLTGVRVASCAPVSPCSFSQQLSAALCPSLISRTVSVDIKHHVYLLYCSLSLGFSGKTEQVFKCMSALMRSLCSVSVCLSVCLSPPHLISSLARNSF